MKSLLLFVAGSLAFGAASLAAAFLMLEWESFVQGAVAFALVFIPAASTLAWVMYSYRSTPDMQLLASLGGSGVRMGIVLGGGMVLTSSLPDAFDRPFWAWLVLFYLVMLGFEITLVVRRQPKLNESPQA